VNCYPRIAQAHQHWWTIDSFRASFAPLPTWTDALLVLHCISTVTLFHAIKEGALHSPSSCMQGCLVKKVPLRKMASF
jgi:hypothetical protein